MHDNKPGLTPYEIDFNHTIPYQYQYLINPLKEKGYDVDIFFNTYPSEKLDEYIEKMNPVDVRLKEFNKNVIGYDWVNIWRINIESMNQIIEYQNKTGTWYDYIILFRFDLLPFMDFSKIYIPNDAVSSPTSEDDMLIVIPGYLLTDVCHIFDAFKFSGMIHNYTRILSHYGIKCHTIFTKDFDRNSYPFFRNIRHMFVPKDHIYYEHDVEDIFNPDHPKYGLKYQDYKQFVSSV